MTLLLLALACGDKDTTVDSGPIDADADADADADTDTDADADADYGYASFSGTVNYKTTDNGDTVCDTVVSLSGSPYSGTCEGCDFAFLIDATIDSEGGTEDCYNHPYFTYVEDTWAKDLWMAHSDSYPGYYGDYADAFIMGFSYDYYGYLYPGYYFIVSSDDDYSYGTFARTDDDIEWSFDYTSDDYDLTYYDGCDYGAEYSYADENFGGDSVSGSVDCDGELADVWTFDATEGSTISVSVDTVGEDTAFDTYMYINGPDGCTFVYADDNYDCTFEPTEYQCSAYEWDAATSGTYAVVIASYGSCTGETAEYSLSVRGADGDIGVEADDAESSTLVSTFVYDADGSGTLVPE